MSFINEVKKGFKKAEKTIRNVGSSTIDFIKNIPRGSSGDEYRAQKCFDVLGEHYIQVCMQETGEEIRSAQEFLDKGLYVYQKFSGRYNLKSCLKALAKRGVVECNTLGDVMVNKPSSDKCFDIFKQNDISMCLINTNIHMIQKDDSDAALDCVKNEYLCQIAPDLQLNIYDWADGYSLELCQQEFAQRGIISCTDDHIHGEL